MSASNYASKHPSRLPHLQQLGSDACQAPREDKALDIFTAFPDVHDLGESLCILIICLQRCLVCCADCLRNDMAVLLKEGGAEYVVQANVAIGVVEVYCGLGYWVWLIEFCLEALARAAACRWTVKSNCAWGC